MEGFFAFVIVLGLLQFIAPVAFIGLIIWLVMRAQRQVQRQAQIYNAHVEQLLVQLFTAIQQQQGNQVRAIQSQIEGTLQTLPSQEQKVYKHKLTDVVRGRQKLDPTTGEWVEG
jgi:hypothetical protein